MVSHGGEAVKMEELQQQLLKCRHQLRMAEYHADMIKTSIMENDRFDGLLREGRRAFEEIAKLKKMRDQKISEDSGISHHTGAANPPPPPGPT